MIPWLVDQIPALQDDRVNEVFQYVFSLHLLKSYESQRSKGKCCKDTQPADYFRIEELAGDKVCDQRRNAGDRRADELSRIEAEKYGLCIASYFFVDSYFHRL